MSVSGANQRHNKKRLLVICQHYWPESFRLNDIVDFLVDKECDIEVLCGIPNYPAGKFYDGYSYFRNRKQVHNGVSIRRALEIPRGNNTNFRILVNYMSFPFTSLFHIPRLLTKKFDRIFIYQLSPVMMGVSGIIVGKLRHIETAMYVLDLWPENLFSVLDIKNPFARWIVTTISHWHYRHVDKLVVLSEKMKLKLIEVANLPEDKFIVLPQACEKIYEQEISDKQLAARFKTGFNVLFTGNISPAQSFPTIISAAKKIKSQGINDINWIIVGDGMSRKWLEKEVKVNGLTDSFYFEGFKPIEEIPKYTNIADVLIGCLVKSDLLEATIPAKVLSYFAAGRPIVLAMDGEAQDLVNSIGCGFAGPTEDVEKLVSNIKSVYLATKKERNLMGKRAKDYHFKNFERNLVLNKLYGFIFD